MSGQTIHIGGMSALPEISTLPDVGGVTMEISDIHDLDLGLLGNQRKVASSAPSPGGQQRPMSDAVELRDASDNIEFVNIDDTNTTYDLRSSGSSGGDTIKILRDESTAPASPSISFGAPSSPPVPAAPSNGGGTWFTGSTVSAPPAAAPAPAPASGGFASGIRSWFGGGGGNSNSSGAAIEQQPTATYLTPEQEFAKKTEYLTLLERLDKKGVGGTKMTMINTLDEIEAELARRKDSKALEASIRFQRTLLTTVTNGMEFLNSRYDPLGVALDGWSEQVHENIEDYDEIFEELYDKYKDKSKVAPEVRLIMTLGLSAAMCHVTNTMFKSKMPGVDEIFRKNPDLARQMAAAAAEQAVGPGFANFMSMGAAQPRRGGAPTPPPEMAAPRMPPSMMQDNGGFMPPMGSGVGAPIPTMDPRGSVDVSAPATARREMRGPSGVEDILRKLNTGGAEMPSRVMPPPGIDADEINSIGSGVTGVTTETMRRAGQSRRRKATTTQPTGATLTLNV